MFLYLMGFLLIGMGFGGLLVVGCLLGGIEC